MFREPTQPEIDTIIAALRLWQCIQENRLALVTPDGGPAGLDHFEDVSTCMGAHLALEVDQIDTLLDEVYGIA